MSGTIDLTVSEPTQVQTITIQVPGTPGSPGTPGPTGAPGPSNVLTIGTITTGAPGSSAAATITGVSPNQTLNLTIPAGANGATGPANTLTIGTITDVPWGTSASATITGTSPNQTLNLSLQSGPPNNLSIGTVTTGAAGSQAAVTVSGTTPNQTLNFTIPQGVQGIQGAQGIQGPQGVQGPAGANGAAGQGFNFRGAWAANTAYNPYDVVTYGGQTYEASTAFTSASTFTAANWNLWAQMGATGATGAAGAAGANGAPGPANTLAIGTVSTGAAGSSAAATITGASPNQTLNLTIPTGATGAQGPQGATGAQGPAGATGAAGNGVLFLNAGDAVPAGTPANTVIYRPNTVKASMFFWGSGTAFPTSGNLGVGDTYWRTDLGASGSLWQYTGNSSIGLSGWLRRGPGDTTLGESYLTTEPVLAATPSWTDLAVVTANSYGGTVTVRFNVNVWNAGSGSDRTASVQVTCDGTVLTPSGSVYTGFTVPIGSVASGSNGPRIARAGNLIQTGLAAGSHTWKIQANASTASALMSSVASLVVVEK